MVGALLDCGLFPLATIGAIGRQKKRAEDYSSARGIRDHSSLKLELVAQSKLHYAAGLLLVKRSLSSSVPAKIRSRIKITQIGIARQT